MFCVYLTVYKGNVLPKFYIGHSTVARVKNGYRGSVSSKKYKEIWVNEQNNNPHLFKTRILKIFESRSDASTEEVRLQTKYDVARNPKFINLHINATNFYHGGCAHTEETKKKISRTKLKNPYRHNDEQKEKIGLAKKGRSHSEETKAKMRASAAKPEVKTKVKKGAANSVAKRLKLNKA